MGEGRGVRGMDSSRRENPEEQDRDSAKARAPGVPVGRQAPVHHFLEAELLSQEPQEQRNNTVGLIE